MHFPSITTILSVCFLAYIVHSVWLMAQLFMTLKCTNIPCYKSFMDKKPLMQLALFTSVNKNPISSEVLKIYSDKNFNYLQEFEREFEIDVPPKTRRNGTLYMQVVSALVGEPLEWQKLRRDGPTVIHTTSMVEYMVPRLESFNLLGKGKNDATSSANPDKAIKTVNHLLSKIHISLLTDSISLSIDDVPPEMARLIHINRNQEILPILKTDFFETRITDLIQVEKHTLKHKFKFHYKPIGIGKLRLMLMVEHAMSMMQNLGFSKRDVDEVKGLLSETNVYLLCGSVFIASIHIFFDFLSFKNDVTFWRKKKSYEGLSTRTTLWRAFSQIIIFLYLLEKNTSLLVLVPACLGVFIEVWKCKKILKLKVGWKGLKYANIETNKPVMGSAERRTEEFDKEGMRYLSYLLYPLIVGGALYSLIYQPHRSWYSWTLNSLVNGVYAFGFLFMMPQLFINYKLKSVAALPWRAFMYKAFNTFIDDFFAFIITMPTAHRVACLRDDVIFLIYLYQRWLYPVDKKRLDIGLSIEETEEIDLLPIEAEQDGIYNNASDSESNSENYANKHGEVGDKKFIGDGKNDDVILKNENNIGTNKKDN